MCARLCWCFRSIPASPRTLSPPPVLWAELKAHSHCLGPLMAAPETVPYLYLELPALCQERPSPLQVPYWHVWHVAIPCGSGRGTSIWRLETILPSQGLAQRHSLWHGDACGRQCPPPIGLLKSFPTLCWGLIQGPHLLLRAAKKLLPTTFVEWNKIGSEEKGTHLNLN